MRLASRLVLAILGLILASASGALAGEEGMASWYGNEFHGRRTASGEVFDQEAMTAAHRTLPFGTLVRVTNRDNGAVVILRINDRGPFTRGRILDCSRAGARELGFLLAGTTRVRLETLGRMPSEDDRATPKERRRVERALEKANHRGDGAFPPGLLVRVDEEAGPFEVQVGAFRDPANARRLAERLGAAGHGVRLVDTPGGFTRVRVGPYATRREAELAFGKLDVQEIPIVVRRD